VILVDASVWIQYQRIGNSTLTRLLDAGSVLTHIRS
jgi:hypothetical protein